MRTVTVMAAALLLLAACKTETRYLDSGPPGDGPVITGDGTQPDTVPPGDGTVDDTGVPTDNGVPTDTGVPTDNGAPIACNSSFGQAEACGGTLGGTKWKYVAGCVSSSAWDELKANCPGATVSNVAYTMSPNNTLQFFNNGSLLRTFSGKISGKAYFPQTCAKLGCPTLQAALKVILLGRPGSTATCAAGSASGCDCDVTINLFAFNGGTWVSNGGTVTVTAAGTPYPYHYCISGSTLSYAGTPQNPTDKNVTYVLQATP